LDTSGVALIMSVPVIIGLILQWPVGALSDRYERRRVMSGATLVCASFAFALIWGQSLGVAVVYCLLAGFLVAMVALALTGAYILMDVHHYARIAIVDKGAYTNLPSSTPTVFELEPRTVPDPVTENDLTTTRPDESKNPDA
jgi:MFS family permease